MHQTNALEPSRSPRLRLGAPAPTAHLDPAALLRDLCEAMFVIGHDGQRVHAEIAMSFDLHQRLADWWEEREPEPPALHLVA
jgi:hypothetical protein